MYITKFLVVRGLPIAWPAGKFPVPVVESRDRSGDSRQKHVAAAPYFDCRPAVPGSRGNQLGLPRNRVFLVCRRNSRVFCWKSLSIQPKLVHHFTEKIVRRTGCSFYNCYHFFASLGSLFFKCHEILDKLSSNRTIIWGRKGQKPNCNASAPLVSSIIIF